MSIAYALVCGRIEAYVKETVRVVPNPYDPSINNVEYKSPFGMDCVVPGEEYFVRGTHSELLAIIRAEQEKTDRDVHVVLNQSFLNPTLNERELVRLMVEDGIDLNQITPKRVKAILRDLQPYSECYASLADAYMDYMH